MSLLSISTFGWFGEEDEVDVLGNGFFAEEAQAEPVLTPAPTPVPSSVSATGGLRTSRWVELVQQPRKDRLLWYRKTVESYFADIRRRGVKKTHSYWRNLWYRYLQILDDYTMLLDFPENISHELAMEQVVEEHEKNCQMGGRY